ncbi:hypothetical protein PR002_g26798 [Phytophthora rubi]|uniref:Orc1-like AAA ATPase domain-containing protein n=1 Tax=Phytophthora rubi TaxID=129364 RepID=A0A6A3HUV5_9STRA|nr:hypothetical protein PR002_g26798 [Phytophthora rubi]
MDPLLWLKDAKYFGENFTQGEGKAHVLVVVPKVKSKRPATAKAQRKKLFNALEWREPMRLCTSDGQDWAYQGAPGLVAELAQPLVAHNEAWKLGYEGKQNYAINLVLDGRGTGKSRMLDEMKGLLCEAAKQSQQQELVERMKNAYVFRVTFEGGTSSTGNLLDSECPEFDVSYRMLYQLAKDRIEWPKFVDQLVESYPSLFLCIEEVMEILATLEKIGNMKNMTVILCVDGLQQLVYDGTKSCAFYRVLATICGFLNSSRAFAVCVCSATMEIPVERALSYSSQWRVYLSPPVLRGEDVLKPRTKFEKRLVDDMGGHGRALETLASVLRQYTKDELEQPASVFDQTQPIAKLWSLDLALVVDMVCVSVLFQA